MWLLLVGAAACGQAQPTETTHLPYVAAEFARPQTASASGWNPGDPQAACKHWAVATAHPLATRAAEQALEHCGSAVDAWVAASVMLTVVQPQSTGIGGGGFAVVVDATGQKPATTYDFRETAPAATQLADYLGADGRAIAARSQRGGLAVAVPGYVAGLWTLHRKYGKLPWQDLVRPAADVAARGFPIGGQLAAAIALVQPTLDPAALALFAPDGRPLRKGEILRMPRLARTLERIAREGPNAFYRGAVAEDIVDAVQAAGGRLSLADLAAYQVREVAPLRGRVFGLEAVTMAQPSAGGSQVLAMAELLDKATTPAQPLFGADDGNTAHALVEAMRRAFLLRLAFSGDATHPATTLDQAFPPAARTALNVTLDMTHATPTAQLPKVTGMLERGANTSHVSIIDGRGLIVSSTHTVNLLLGAGMVAPKSGVLLNDEMDDFSYTTQDRNAFGLQGSTANLVRPGARPVSSMSPIVLLRDGQPMLAAGTPGGTHIPTTVLQILAWRLRGGLSLAQAMARLRVHHQAFPDVAEIEEGQAGDAIAAELTRRGHVVARRSPWCNGQAVAVQPAGDVTQLQAASDPRGEGGATAR